jgi:3-oxoadipate enol-lactonase
MLRATPREGYATCCEAIATFDIRNQLSHITAPALVIAGAEDPVTPVPIVQSIAAGVRDAQFLTVPGASHLVNAERADTVSNAIRAHLTGQPVPDAIRLGTPGHRQ